jgi:cobalt/nickel transport system permease protein
MKLILDKYAYLKSPIHHWNQKPKLVALLSLIFAFAMVQKLSLLPLIIILTIILYLVSNLPFSFLLDRLRYPGIFILAVVVLLPFFAGKTIIFSWGFLAIKKEGCLAVLLIVVRFICILTVSLVLFGTAPFLTTIKAMKSLGLSSIIVDMMLLTYRYLEELGDTLITMQRSLILRGFKFNRLSKRNLQIIANLMGTLFVRSYERSKMIYKAMILRGYGQKDILNLEKEKLNYQHWLACYGLIFISLMIITVEFLW